MGGSESYQSSVPSQFTANLAGPAEPCEASHESTQNGQRSHADDGSIGPSALSASNAVTGSALAQQTATAFHRQRARPVPTAAERRPMHAVNQCFDGAATAEARRVGRG